jgi:O-antigen/teichoic acid export membrane protein
MRIDQIMIKEMLGKREVGLYSAAVRLSEAWYFIPIIITSSLFPSVVNAKKVSESLYYSRIQHLYSFMFLLSFSIALLMTFLSDWMMVLLYGEAYREAGQVLMINIWAGVFVFLGVASSKWFLSEGLQNLLTVNTVIGAIVNVILNFILIPKYGICGAAIATVISQSIASYFMNFLFSETRSNFLRLTKSIVYK